MEFTQEEIQIILQALRKEYGFGYSGVEVVEVLQAKLSIMFSTMVEE